MLAGDAQLPNGLQKGGQLQVLGVAVAQAAMPLHPHLHYGVPARLEQCLAETSPPSSQMMTLPEVSTATSQLRPRV